MTGASSAGSITWTCDRGSGITYDGWCRFDRIIGEFIDRTDDVNDFE